MNVNNRLEILQEYFCTFKEKINKRVGQIQIKLQSISIVSQPHENHKSEKTQISSQPNLSLNLNPQLNHKLQIQLDQIKQLKKKILQLDQIEFVLDQYVQKLIFDEQTQKININLIKITQLIQNKFEIQNQIIQNLSKQLNQHIKIDQSVHQKLNLLENKVQTQEIRIEKQNQQIKSLENKVQEQQVKILTFDKQLKQIQSKINTTQQKLVEKMNTQWIQKSQQMNSKLKQIQQRIELKERSINQMNQQQQANKKQTNTKLAKLEQNLLIQQNEQNSQAQNVKNSLNIQKIECSQNHKKFFAFFQTLKKESFKEFSTNYKLFKAKQNQIRWSPQFKATDIKITGLVAEQTNQKSNQMALIGPCLPFNNTKTRWAIQINKQNNSICVGISLKSIIAKQNYLFKNWTKIGHGQYLIGSGSQTYSHSDANYNGVFHKSFKFVAGDTIFMEFDSASRIMRFRRNRSAEKFQFDVVAPENDSYYPSVQLYGVGCLVSLVDGQPLS